MEARLSGIEGRLGVLEDRMSSMLSLIVRIAERLDRGKSMIHEGAPSAFAAAANG